MKIFLILLASLLGLMVVVETALRLLFGLGNPPLYIPDGEIGYLLAPNQKVKRMGNRILVNQYSMRTKDITATKPENTVRIFLVGDSIANGGWWTDQDETISALLERKLGELLPDKQIEVLNASANSWNPRNELAYLRRFGLFNSDVLVLLINTDDLFGTPPTSLGVGRSRNYPQVKPLLALTEVLSKFQSNPVIPELRQIQQEGGDRVGKNLAAIRAIKQLTTQANTSFILALTPLRREIEPGSKDYEIKARNRLKEFTLREQISYLDFLPLFAKFQPIESLYRDHIHLSPQGNQLVVKQISQMLATK